jgi:hypothetical protein
MDPDITKSSLWDPDQAEEMPYTLFQIKIFINYFHYFFFTKENAFIMEVPRRTMKGADIT